nr:MAG TPA: hypothetical protein [Caudoviricetes sp.]
MAVKRKEINLTLDAETFSVLKVNKLDDIILTIKIKNIETLEGNTVQLFIKKPNGVLVEQESDYSINETYIVFNVKNGAFDTVGTGKGQLRIIDDKGKISTSKFKIVISDVITDSNSIINEIGIEAFDNLKAEVEQLKASGATEQQIAAAVQNYLRDNPVSGLTSEQEEKLNSLNNYDDTQVKLEIKDLQDNQFSGDYNDLTNKPSIPSIEGLASETFVTTKISEASLGGGEVDLSAYALKSQLHDHSNKLILDSITSSDIDNWNNSFSGDYNDLINKPTIDIDKNYVDTSLATKVNKETGKSLISDTEIARLSNVSNYDDTEIRGLISNHTHSQYLTEIPSEYVTETELNNKGYLTSHQDLSTYALKTELHNHSNKLILDSITSDKVTEWNNKANLNHTHTVSDITNFPSFESNSIVTNTISNGGLILSTDKYQYVEMEDATSIILPSVSDYTEIHLFFATTADITLDLPNITWQNNTIPETNANKKYEFIFSYINSSLGWLGGAIIYE